jgi:hypothetical protein
MNKLIIALLFSVSSLNVFASDSKREAIEQLFELTSADSMVNTMYSKMDGMMQGMGQALGAKESDKAIVDKYMSKVVAIMKSEASWEKMKEPLIDVYSKHYSEKEVKDIVAFYKTESGQSMIKKTPAIMSESMFVSKQMMSLFIPKIQKLTEDLKIELKAANE